MNIEEMVTLFLYNLSYDAKNMIVKREFLRRRETISRQFGLILLSLLRLYKELFKQPYLMPQDSIDL